MSNKDFKPIKRIGNFKFNGAKTITTPLGTLRIEYDDGRLFDIQRTSKDRYYALSLDTGLSEMRDTQKEMVAYLKSLCTHQLTIEEIAS